MEKMKKKLGIVLLLLSNIILAQTTPNPGCPSCGTGGGGGVTPGAQSVPIDMYVFVLAIAAISMIAYFAKKYKTQKI